MTNGLIDRLNKQMAEAESLLKKTSAVFKGEQAGMNRIRKDIQVERARTVLACFSVN